MRIRPNDCLHHLIADLRLAAKAVKPWDAEGLDRWMNDCAAVLAQFACRDQRTAIAYDLAMARRLLSGASTTLLLGELVRRAEQIQPALSEPEAWLKEQLDSL